MSVTYYSPPKMSPLILLRTVIITSFLGSVSGCFNSAASLHALVDSPSTAEGWVSGVNCNNHGAVYYAFSANGREFRAKAPWGSLDCKAAKRGDRIRIFYLAADPAVNTILDPREAYVRAKGWYIPEWAWIAFFSLAAIATPIFTSYSRTKPSRRPGNTNSDD